MGWLRHILLHHHLPTSFGYHRVLQFYGRSRLCYAERMFLVFSFRECWHLRQIEYIPFRRQCWLQNQFHIDISRYDFPQRLMPVIIFTFPFHLFCISRDMYSFRSITIFFTLDDSYCNFCRTCDCFCSRTRKICI